MTGLFWLSALLDAAAVAMVLLARRRWWVSAVVVALALKVALVLSVLEGRFGLIHIVYLDVVVALPMVGAVVLLAGRRRGWRLAPPLALALLALAPVGVYASFVEPFRLRIERTSVPLSPARSGHGGLRIAVLADIQTARVNGYDREAVERAIELRPDVVLVPGDLFQMGPRRFRDQLPALRAQVWRLRAPGGVFVVPGDADGVGELREAIAGTGARLLVNETVTTVVRDRRLTIAGIELDWRSASAQRTMSALESRPGAGDVRLLLAHRPDVALELPSRPRTDLVVAGHTHGGQVRVPGFGPPITLSSVPRDVAGGGLHVLPQSRRVYVSRGIGVEHGARAPRIRFLCPPELSLLTLRG